MHAPKEPTTPIEKSRQLQRKLYYAAKANPRRRFHALYDRIHRFDVLWRAWLEVRANQGIAGVDGVTIQDIEKSGPKEYLGRLQDDLKLGKYQPSRVKRVYIPKPDGTKRPLGIPTVKDRIVQQAARIVIEPLFEACFLPCSYGFRPKRSAQQALVNVKASLVRNWHVVDADIRSFFDTINHEILFVLLKRRISDRKVLKLIRQWLKAGILDGQDVIEAEEGTPQGGVISPLLANIYLHVLDSEWTRKFSHLGKLVRYADDFLVICRYQSQAKKAHKAVEAILGKLKLTLNREKTRIVDIGNEGMNFLGFYLRKCPSRRTGKLVPLMWPSPKAMKSIRTRIKLLTSSRWKCITLESVADRLSPLIRGFRNYFRIGNSALKFRRLDHYIEIRLWKLYWKQRNRKNEIFRKSYKAWRKSFGPERFYLAGQCVIKAVKLA